MKKISLCFFLIWVSLGLAWAQEKQPAPPRGSEAAFSQQREQLIRQFEQEKQQLAAQFEAMGQESEDLQRRVRQVEKKLKDSKLTLAFCQTIGKNLGFGIAHIFFPLLVVNLCLYLYFKEKAFFNR